MKGPRKPIEPPLKLDMSFGEALSRFSRVAPKEINEKRNGINHLTAKSSSKEIISMQGELFSQVETDVGGIGMGVLSDGTPYLNQRGLAALCGVQNAHIGTISTQWVETEQKPRITRIKDILKKSGFTNPVAHVEIIKNGRVNYCYPAEVCLAVLEYYAFDAGTNCQEQARDNFRLLAGSKLRELIYVQTGYDPSGADQFTHWHERIALNFQSAPKGFFHVFNEAHTIIYELILAGAKIDSKFVVDISIGSIWSRYWDENQLAAQFGARTKYPHNYPDTHPQARANPHESWCYPLASLGAFREWLQDTYIEGGKFSTYLKGKVSRGELPPSVAQLAISTLVTNSDRRSSLRVKRSLSLDTITFDKSGDATAFFRAILNRYRLGEEIPSDDARHLHALLKRHDESQEKIGAGVPHFEVGTAPDGFGTRCFWIVREDETKIDFSYKHCLEPKRTDNG